ncbi:MAG TPA: HNH endonuclease signature motif containing protein [Egibacteraceae bacterium]|nr:HNH endonuclease signature motif containing protein [Egibacteraceae bacterium]
MSVYLDDPDFTDACLPWWGYIGQDGYGRVNRRRWRNPQLAHRVIYEECFGEIPARAQIHHRCTNRACVNPAHLALARTDREHKRLHAAERTHCRRGHAYAEDGRRHANGNRYCRACERENERRRAAVR